MRAASCTSLWTRSSCLMNPPTKPMTRTGGVALVESAKTERLPAPSGSRAPCAGPVCANTKMATSEKIEAQIEAPNRRYEIAFLIRNKYPPKALSQQQYLTHSPAGKEGTNAMQAGVALLAL